MSEEILKRLTREYQDVTPAQIKYFDGKASSTAFARSVAASRPFVIRGYGRNRACAGWTAEILAQKVTEEIEVAITPNGKADAVHEGLFVEPHLEQMTMPRFLELLNDRQADPAYFQAQNSCLTEPAFASLLEDVGDPPAFAVEYFDTQPDAINIWLGSDRSVTSVHSDPYENLYMVVRGRKTFTLFPPVEFPCFHVKPFPRAKWERKGNRWQVVRQEGDTPWSPIDVLKPDLKACPRFSWARPLTVEVEAGDLLCLPALWLHHVQQSGSLTIAVNWWFDLDYSSPVWHLHRLVRSLTMQLDGQELDCDQEVDN